VGAALVVLLVGLGALAAGVLIGRYYVPDDRMLKRSARHSRAYMRALIHHIARDHDNVITELRKVVEENVEDSEPYFALAALFRARNEHDRAIRVHQALAVREGATHRLRMRALYELGLDFRAAGMPRRAARALEDVLTSEPRHEGALRALCGMYEEQGRFAEAAGAWARLCKLRGEQPPRRHHHLLCAAAQRAIAENDLDSAKRLLKDARASTPDGKETAHFFAAAAELAAARKNPKAARERIRQALTASPELARFLVPGLNEAERQLASRNGEPAAPAASATADDLDEDATAIVVHSGALDPASERAAAQAAAATLVELADATRNPHLAVAAAEALGPIDGTGALERFRKVAADSPEYLPARIAAARLAIASKDADAIAAELAALAADGGALAWADGASWRCSHCGARATAFSWRCAACRRWGSARPEVGRERVIVQSAPRERRAEPRLAVADQVGRTLLGDSAITALPSAEIDHGLSDAELTSRSARRSAFGRMGGWISGAVSGMRRKKA
jgi:lipopolysaccharide biosynthesis regulator YciM